jgi:hypothetical protein
MTMSSRGTLATTSSSATPDRISCAAVPTLTPSTRPTPRPTGFGGSGTDRAAIDEILDDIKGIELLD